MLDVIKKANAHKLESFVAPVFWAKETRIFTMQEGIPYTFPIKNVEPGWYLFSPTRKDTVQPTRRAEPVEYLNYLQVLMPVHVVALLPLGENTWLCSPYNKSDGIQKGLGEEPLVLHLTRGLIRPFDLILARNLSGTIIFDDQGTAIDSQILQTARNITLGVNEPFKPPTAIAEMMAIVKGYLDKIREKTIEDKARDQLEFMGAELVSFQDEGSGLWIEWSHKGRTHKMHVQKNLRIASAGVCLDGTDREHNLSSIVAVMEERHRTWT